VVGALLLLALLPARAAVAAALTAEVDRDTLSLGEQLQLRVGFRAEGMGWSPELAFDFGDDFEVTARSTGRTLEFNNGRATTATTLLYVLRPVRAGRLTIPALTVDSQGERLASQPIAITVVEAGGGAAPAPPSARATPVPADPPAGEAAVPLFLELTLAKGEVVVGEPVVVSLYLYTRLSVISLDFATPPDFPDCWVEELVSPKVLTLEEVEARGRRYGRALLLSRLITPNRAGELTLPAVAVAVRHRTPGRGNAPFAMLMEPAATQTVASAPVTLHVVEPPAADRPATFTGAVGRFTAEASLDPATTRVGEPVRWVVRVRGTGNFRALKLPLPELPEGLESFDTDRDCQLKPTADGATGECTFTTLVVPRQAGDFTLPPPLPAWFDPATGAYVTATLDPFSLHVAAAAQGGSGGISLGPRAVTLLRQEIHYLAGDAALAVGGAPPWVERPAFWAAVAAPPLFFGGAGILALVRRRASHRRPAAARRAALRDAAGRLEGAPDLATVRTLVEVALAAIVGRGVGGLMRDQLSAALAAAGQPAPAIAAVATLLDRLDAAAFAPGGGDVASLASAARSAIATLTVGGTGGGRPAALLCALVAAATLATAANEPAGQIAAAREAYVAGDYGLALRTYEDLLAAGESAPRHYNAGCAAYQAGDLGRAIYHWERARYLDPTLADATANLEVARLAAVDQVQATEVPRLSWLATHETPLAAAGVAAWWALAVVVGLAQRRPRDARDGWILALVGLLVAFTTVASLLALAHHQRATFPLAICLATEQVAHSGPGETFPEVFTLHAGAPAGAPAPRLARQGDWLRIRLGERLVGWLPAVAVAEVATGR